MSYQQSTPPEPPRSDPMSAVGQPKRRLPGTGMLITGLILLGVSIIGGIIGIILSVMSMVDDFTSFADSTHEITEHVSVEGLGDQTWYIYQDPAAAQATCSVIDAQGNNITRRAATMEFSTLEESLVAWQSFQSTADGNYEIECSAYPVALGSAVPVSGVIPLLLSAVGAGLLFVLGVVLTIVGAIRRSRAKRQLRPPNTGGYGFASPPQAPGSYPPHP